MITKKWEAKQARGNNAYKFNLFSEAGRIATIDFQSPDDIKHARLIAAAPELLEACKNVANMACIPMICQALEQRLGRLRQR